MRLRSATITAFKNLRDFTVDFDSESPFTVLVGENGSGKSNLIEALTLIFRHLDLEIAPPFPYFIWYECAGNELEVNCLESTTHPQYRVRSKGAKEFTEISRKRFMAEDQDGQPLYRPAFVFGYYSGPSDRLAALFERHRERYYAWIIKSAAQRRGITLADPNVLRRLFYAQTLHGQFALIAFFMEPTTGPDDDRAFLRKHLQIDGLDSVLFVLNQPPWSRKGGDPRFWNAEGEVRDFLDRLYDASLCPMRMERRLPAELTKRPAVESLYLFLRDSKALEDVYRSYGDQYAFFTALESTHLSRLLGEVRTRVRMVPSAGGGAVTYRDLSEGEQQLLLVLGLLKFTARNEALFFLDEPDTHLNPAWSTQYLEFLDRFIRLRERGDTCHIVMSTHDPLVFAGLERSQVRIFHRGQDGAAVAQVPAQDPRGMGVAAILTSDLFGLRSTLDPKTQGEIDRQRSLSMKSVRTEEEEHELRDLKTRLRGKGFSQSIRDPLYEQFIRAWTASEDPSWRDAVELSAEQREARARLADDIVAKLRGEGS